MSRIVHLDGALVPERDARISPFDRGFLLGDAVFETLRAYGGAPFQIEEHLARLAHSCRVARLPVPDDLPVRIAATLAANDLRDAAVRVTVSRGPGGAGASPRDAGPPTVLVTATPIPYPEEVYARGLRLATAGRRRVPGESLESGIKTTNYLVHVLARAEAEERGADDALFVDREDRVVEATQANVFAVLGDRLVTPSLESGCLPGTARAFVLGLAAEVGLVAQERPLARRELAQADEAFLTASVLEVCGLVALDGQPVGGGAPGSATRRLHALYRKHALRARPEGRNEKGDASSVR